MVDEVGLALAGIAMLAVGIGARGRFFRPRVGFRIAALIGEIFYFTHFAPSVGAVLFVAGGVFTVIGWFGDSAPMHMPSLIEVVELVAWLWMALAIH